MTILICKLLLTFLVSTSATINDFDTDASSYYFENSKKCSDLNNLNCDFNPDDYLNVPQIIKRHGYPSESHIIKTLDGYLLTVFRISGSKDGKKGGQPVLLQHGLSGDSAPWVICDNNSLGMYFFITTSYKILRHFIESRTC